MRLPTAAATRATCPKPRKAQSATPITKIRGTIGGANDVDVYAIYISDPSTFSATTIGGTTLDTALWLFDEDGKGVVYNDDNPDATTGTQSRIDNRTLLHHAAWALLSGS
jgi:hypothetical protein